MNKKYCLENLVYKKIKVNDKYRFFNSNYNFDDSVVPFFKHDQIVEKLKNRIAFSNGTSILITGLRGVGKSTLVKRALNELKANNISCLPVYITLSKEIEYTDLLFEIIRRLYETLLDSVLFHKIDSDIVNAIVVSYSRTSMSISNSRKINGETSVSIKNNSLLGNILVKNKLTQQAAEEASFLAYSENDVEHDLLRIINLLNGNKQLKIKTIIVFDEIDKLTNNDKGMQYFENILGKLKNVLCSVDTISIFIGGLDLHQKWNDDVAKINSLYDSIFSWHQYVPCIWDSTESLFDLITEKEYVYERIPKDFEFICENKYSNVITPAFKELLVFINFKSKGIPRRIYSEFNNFIVWNKGKPYFQISEMKMKEINSYSKIWHKIYHIFKDESYKTIIEMDLTYVVCFNLIECFFLHSDEEFTFEQVRNVILYDEVISPINIDEILRILINKFIIHHIIQEKDSGKFIVTDITIKEDKGMSVKDKNLLQKTNDYYKFSNFKQYGNYDVYSSFDSRIQGYSSNEISSFWNKFDAKEFVLGDANLSIFLVENKATKKKYEALLYNENNDSWRNKNYLYNQKEYKLTSKYLLDTTDIIINSNIKTSLREIYCGYSLLNLINAKIRMNYIMLIIEQLLNFIVDLNACGYFNANIKAANIMINKFVNIKLLDVKNAVRTNSQGNLIHMIGYAAPEMYSNDYDARGDIYSVGVLLWEMINHKRINQVSFERHLDFQALSKPSKCSKKLWRIILKATSFDPDQRYENAEEFLEDIKRCHEYKKNKLKVRKDVSVGTVTNLYARQLSDTFINKNKVTQQNVNVNNEYTTILGETTDTTVLMPQFIPKMEKVFLIRVSTNEMVLINKTVFTIGKEKDHADFYINDNSSISRLHAKIVTGDSNYSLIDLNSSNGTYLNEKRIQPNQKTLLEDGDIIKLANEEFVFKTEQE